MAGADVRALLPRHLIDHLRDQPPLPAPGADALARRRGAHARGCRSSRRGAAQQIRMAHLATVGSHSVNGVARLHTELIKQRAAARLLRAVARSASTTRPTASRRGAGCCTPTRACRRAGLERLGTELDAGRTWRRCRACASTPTTPTLLDALAEIKLDNKRAPGGAASSARSASSCRPGAMFVVQVKRIHEYKRQLLACCEHHRALPEAQGRPDQRLRSPRAYIFAGKAAAGYAMAKLHIRLINDVADVDQRRSRARADACAWRSSPTTA